MSIDLHGTEWDCCVIGNGVAPLWLSHWLWSERKSVLWITSEPPYGPDRGLLQHGWLWGVGRDHADALGARLSGFDAGGDSGPFEIVYYDARSARRFRPVAEAKPQWGSHERAFFELCTSGAAGAPASPRADLWGWHSRLHAFHDSGQESGLTCVELFREPRFVRAQGWPLLELKTQSGRIAGAVLAGLRPSQPMEIEAAKFYLADYDEYLPGLIKETTASQALAGALKGRAACAGFGLRLRHSGLGAWPTQTAIVPLLVNPTDEDGASHVVGRFLGEESLWIGLLNEDEVEDNNEILKKIKQARRALERAVPGFGASIVREAVTFSPRMCAVDLLKARKSEVLGARLLSDQLGPDAAAESVRAVISSAPAKGRPEKHGEGPACAP